MQPSIIQQRDPETSKYALYHLLEFKSSHINEFYALPLKEKGVIVNEPSYLDKKCVFLETHSKVKIDRLIHSVCHSVLHSNSHIFCYNFFKSQLTEICGLYSFWCIVSLEPDSVCGFIILLLPVCCGIFPIYRGYICNINQSLLIFEV